MPKPRYKRPDADLVRHSLEMAAKHAHFVNPRLVSLDTTRIVPREVVMIENDHVRLMQEAPETVPPIVVAPWGDVHVVVDGHHRLAASLEAGLEDIWAVKVDLKKLKNLVWPSWY